MHNRVVALFIVALLQQAFTLAALGQESPSLAQWTQVAPALEVGIAQLKGGLFPGEVTLLRSELSKLHPRVVRADALGKRRGNTEWFAKKTGAALCVNGNFFGKDGKALGLVVSKGVKYHPVQFGGSLLTGLFLVYRERLAIIPREKGREEFGLEALQAGPLLVAEGQPLLSQLESNNQSRRSGICLNNDQQFTIFVVSSTLRGASLREIAQILAHPSVGCQEALNLDGGGSTQLYVSSQLSGAMDDFNGINLVGRDDVPTALCLFPAGLFPSAQPGSN